MDIYKYIEDEFAEGRSLEEIGQDFTKILNEVSRKKEAEAKFKEKQAKEEQEKIETLTQWLNTYYPDIKIKPIEICKGIEMTDSGLKELNTKNWIDLLATLWETL